MRLGSFFSMVPRRTVLTVQLLDEPPLDSEMKEMLWMLLLDSLLLLLPLALLLATRLRTKQMKNSTPESGEHVLN